MTKNIIIIMKRLISIAFATALALTITMEPSRNSDNRADYAIMQQANVEAMADKEIDENEFIVFCQVPAGLCWKLDEKDVCVWTGSMQTYCS